MTEFFSDCYDWVEEAFELGDEESVATDKAGEAATGACFIWGTSGDGRRKKALVDAALSIDIQLDDDPEIYSKLEERAQVGDWVYVARGNPLAFFRRQLSRALSSEEAQGLEDEAEAALKPILDIVGKAPDKPKPN